MNIKSLLLFLIVIFTASAQIDLTGTAWRLESLCHSRVNVATFDLTFTSDTTAMSTMQCATCCLAYKVTDTSFSFNRGVFSRVTCEEKKVREAEYGIALWKVKRWTMEGDRLLLMSCSDTLMVFVGDAGEGVQKQACGR